MLLSEIIIFCIYLYKTLLLCKCFLEESNLDCENLYFLVHLLSFRVYRLYARNKSSLFDKKDKGENRILYERSAKMYEIDCFLFQLWILICAERKFK